MFGAVRRWALAAAGLRTPPDGTVTPTYPSSLLAEPPPARSWRRVGIVPWRRTRHRRHALTEVKGMNERPALGELGLSTGKKGLSGSCSSTACATVRPVPAVRPGAGARPARLLRQPGAGRPALHHRLALEGGFNGIVIQIGLAEKFYGLRRRGPADPQAERQDRHPLGRRGALAAATPASTTRSGWARTRSATRSTSARPRRTRTSRRLRRSARTRSGSACR